MAHLPAPSRVDVAGDGLSFADTIGTLSAAWGGWTPREIDVGGGFASPRDPTGRATTRGMQRRADERSPTIEAYADTVATSLREGLRRHGVSTDGIRLEAEPGRALLADTGIHLATVRNVKRRRDRSRNAGSSWTRRRCSCPTA
jgi:diaminopimelate decarboxylase